MSARSPAGAGNVLDGILATTRDDVARRRRERPLAEQPSMRP
ncbi:MAG: hypothetical protein QOF77_621, partial [Solirubrobacteraceae bacterium]|nr:hypothetical protein [Solirubrobacteraceae bacterium]